MSPAVVLVMNRSSGGLCTGTIISPRVVLTAKHCVQRPAATAPEPGRSLVVLVGNNVNRPMQYFNVQEARTTAGAYTDDFRGAIQGVDVGVVILATAATITPMTFRRDAPTDIVAQDVVVIGFGETPAGEVGIKYRATKRVATIQGNVIFSNSAICQGDSGGPMIDSMGRVVGVASFGFNGSCGTGYNGHNRIDPFLDMIDTAVRDTGGPCVPSGAERCDGVDNDCNEQIDETCTPIGGTCSRDDECQGAKCDETPTGKRCTATCDPLKPAVGCPPDMYCARKPDTCEGVCAAGTLSTAPRGNGAACASNTDCNSLNCADPGDGAKRCLDACKAGEGLCIDDEVCTAPAGACGTCFDATLVQSVRGLGEPCTEDASCASGKCIRDGEARYCSVDCRTDTDCVRGTYHCRRATSDDENKKSCIRGPRESLGGTCVTNDDCVARTGTNQPTFCARLGGAAWCSTFCSADSECTPGMTCDVADPEMPTLRVCAPAKKLLGEVCTADDQCLSSLCVQTNSTRICARNCTPSSTCPTGLACQRTSDGLGAVCVPIGVTTPMTGDAGVTPPPPRPPGGCCSVARSQPRSPFAALSLLFALTMLTARRSRALVLAARRSSLGTATATLISTCALVVGCASESPTSERAAPAGRSTAAILNGAMDPVRRGIVYIRNDDVGGGGLFSECTGTLIAPRIVLTAKHCVRAGSEMRVSTAAMVSARTGLSPRMMRPDAIHPASEIRVAAGAWPGPIFDGTDIAVLILRDPIEDTPTYRVSFDDVSTLADQDVTLVGFGYFATPRAPENIGIRMSYLGHVQAIALHIEVEVSACPGDSGGPLLGRDDRVWGVASHIIEPTVTTNPPCGRARYAILSQATNRTLIETALTEIAGGEFGVPCTTSATCRSGVCAGPTDAKRCSKTCAPFESPSTCGTGYFCAPSTDCTGQCWAGSPGRAPFGSACTTATDCASLLCMNVGSTRACATLCKGASTTAGETCSADSYCSASAAGRCGGCFSNSLLDGGVPPPFDGGPTPEAGIATDAARPDVSSGGSDSSTPQATDAATNVDGGGTAPPGGGGCCTVGYKAGQHSTWTSTLIALFAFISIARRRATWRTASVSRMD